MEIGVGLDSSCKWADAWELQLQWRRGPKVTMESMPLPPFLSPLVECTMMKG